MPPDIIDCLYDDVVLTRDVRERGVCSGDIGTVVERPIVPTASEDGYSVEFFDMIGNTVAVIALPASALRRPDACDRRPYVLSGINQAQLWLWARSATRRL